MKEYKLNNYKPQTQANDAAPGFIQKVTARAKASNEIIGLVRGLLADGQLVESEAKYLNQWIKDRPGSLSDPMVSALAQRLQRTYADGVVTPEELSELKMFLDSYAKDDGTPTSLPLDQPAPLISIPGNTFCFTGVFACGKRAWCEDQIEVRGGEISAAPVFRTYALVLGSSVSLAWANQTYGRKIEAAVAYREAGSKTKIITEEHWLTFLK